MSNEDSDSEESKGDLESLRPKPKRVDAAAVYDLLVRSHDLLEQSFALQTQLAETLIYVKDEIVVVRDKQIKLNQRLKSLEEISVAKVPENGATEIRDKLSSLADVMDAVSSTVNATRSEINSHGSDQIFLDALKRLTGQISILRELVAENIEVC